MDAIEVAKVLESKNLIAIMVLATIAAVPIIKGLFALRSGRHQRRKEFLEFWKEVHLRSDDLWLEEIVQHRYGSALSARVIRHVQQLERPSLKLRKVAMAAGYFDVNDTGDQLVWVRSWRASFGWYVAEALVCGLAYFFFASVGMGSLLVGIRQPLPDLVAFVFVGIAITACACAAFWHLITLTEARATMVLVTGVPLPGAKQWLRQWRALALTTLRDRFSHGRGKSDLPTY